MTSDELAEIEARANAATPGPWEVGESAQAGLHVWQSGRAFWVASIGSNEPPDAAFIAHARADIPALLAEVRRLREESARLENLASALDALCSVLYPPKPGEITRNQWQQRSAAVLEAKRLIKDGGSVIAIIEAERDAARAIADKYMEKAEQLTSDKGIAETREAAARADLARAIELLQCITETPTPIPGVTLGDYHEHVAAFLAEMGKR